MSIILTETEKAYIAGFIDGDGCITIQGSSRFLLGVRITNSSKKVMTWLGEKLHTKIFTYEYPDNPEYATMYALVVNGIFAQELISLIKPYLIIKLDQAEVALSFPISLGGKKLSEEVELQQAICFVKMKRLNKKGRKGEEENGDDSCSE